MSSKEVLKEERVKSRGGGTKEWMRSRGVHEEGGKVEE